MYQEGPVTREQPEPSCAGRPLLDGTAWLATGLLQAGLGRTRGRMRQFVTTRVGSSAENSPGHYRPKNDIPTVVRA